MAQPLELHHRLEIQRGEIYHKLTNDREILLNTESWFAMIKGMREKFSTGTDTILFDAGKAFGSAVIENAVKKFPERQERAAFLAQLASASGWGFFRYDVTPDGAVITSSNNAFADAEGRSGPSCIFLKGIFQALYDVILGEGATVNEIMCRSAGDSLCKFEIKRKYHG